MWGNKKCKFASFSHGSTIILSTTHYKKQSEIEPTSVLYATIFPCQISSRLVNIYENGTQETCFRPIIEHDHAYGWDLVVKMDQIYIFLISTANVEHKLGQMWNESIVLSRHPSGTCLLKVIKVKTFNVVISGSAVGCSFLKYSIWRLLFQYEFRERGIRKTKASLSVSTSGVKVVRQKKKRLIWVWCWFISALRTFSVLNK